MIETKKVKLQLVGLDGNAFSLLGAFQKAARGQGWNEDEIKPVIDEATSSDYSHLVCTLMENTQPPDEDNNYDDCED